MPNNAIGVKILGDPSSLLRSFKRSEVAATQFAGRMAAVNQASRGALAGSGFNKGALLFGSGQFVAAAVAAAAITKSVQAASDLNEQLSKSNVIFGQNAKEVESWSKTLATSFGISERAGLQAAGTFGSIFTNTGQTTAQAAEMSKRFVELAGDLASFNNTSTDDALNALRSGLAGEIEPLRRFQAFLTEASVAQEALRESGKSSVTQLTQGDKVLARYNLILKQTKTAQGDAARTSDSLANQTRQLAANFDNLSANMGRTFLPAANKVVTVLNSLFVGFAKLNSLGGVRVDGSHLNLAQLQELKKRLDDAGASGSLMAEAIDGAIKKLKELNAAAAAKKPILDLSVRDQGFTGADALIDRKALKAALAASAKDFDEFISGIGLKIAKAGLTSGLRDDLAVLQEELRAIDRQEARQGKTFKLETLRVGVLQDIKNIQDQIANDALVKQEAREQRILDLKEKQREALQKQLDARKASQFKALGLTGTGEDRVPGVDALRNRARSLLKQIQGTGLNTLKNRERIGAVLTKQFKDAGRDVRSAILQMFNDISDALNQGDKKLGGALTKTKSLNAKKILAGLDLSSDQERQLRARLSNVNSAGQSLAAAQDVGSTGGQFVVDVHNTVTLDGQKVANNTTRHQQKTKRRNPQQKRGPHRKN